MRRPQSSRFGAFFIRPNCFHQPKLRGLNSDSSRDGDDGDDGGGGVGSAALRRSVRSGDSRGGGDDDGDDGTAPAVHLRRLILPELARRPSATAPWRSGSAPAGLHRNSPAKDLWAPEPVWPGRFPLC